MPASVGAGDLGRYRLDRLLGAGGMGEVYLARDSVLPRDVAIKFLSSGETDPEKLQRQLMREAQAVAALDHPAICVVHDVGVEASGRPFMVMQYVEGETLAARLTRGPLPVRDALALCAHIADALGAAHRRAIIHRDLKPQNVMITPSGAPRVLDFGIAKVLSAVDAAGASAETATNVTESHAFAGTPSYMSPEQVQQRPLDGRSDLFSLGCILYECLTGRRPFAGAQSIDVLAQILHAHPPAPSSLRGELDARHDELIRRLLAKEPADRFQSADELVGALRVLQPDTSRLTGTGGDAPLRRWTNEPGLRRAAAGVAIALALSVTGFAVWRWSHPGLPSVPADAKGYYERGTDALREGTYHKAESSLKEAVRLFPDFPAAWARLAEAHTEMDDDRAAAQDLVRVADQVPDTARLPTDERLRLDAIRSLVLADPDAAVRAYRELAQRRSQDASAWVDLGRAQELAAQLGDARVSFERAVAVQPTYAAAHLRMGILDTLQNRRDHGLAALAEAERLYRAAGDKEGEAEVLIRRGVLLNGTGELPAARVALTQARDIAGVIGNDSQVVRAQLQLGSVTMSEGRFSEAEQLVGSAVQSAVDAGLETAAADGLRDLAAALLSGGRLPEAEAQARKAIAIAEKRGAHRTAAAAATQLASIQSSKGEAAEALRTLEPALAFFEKHKYRQLELTALAIAARAYQDLDDLTHAHDVASEALREAQIAGNDYHLTLALNNLALQASMRGALPEALGLRERAEAIHRRQNDVLQLSYDLTNRAELLIKLGRTADAQATLREIEDNAARKVDAYVQRLRRVSYLRALSAVTMNQFDEAAKLMTAMAPSQRPDSTSVLTAALQKFVDAKRRVRESGQADAVQGPGIPVATLRERDYWTAAAALARGNADAALAIANGGIQPARDVNNDELTWRLAAVGILAARSLQQRETERALHAAAVDALTRLHSAWGDAGRQYDRRPDLAALRAAAGL